MTTLIPSALFSVELAGAATVHLSQGEIRKRTSGELPHYFGHTLGGVSLAMAKDVAETTTIPRVPKNRELPQSQLLRLLQAHEITLQAAKSTSSQMRELQNRFVVELFVESAA